MQIQLLKLLAGATRLHIIKVLTNKTLTVQGIADAVHQTHSATSHQLGLLLAAQIVTVKRQGRDALYSLANTKQGKLARQVINL